MPNQAQQTAESKPKGKKAATPGKTSRAGEPKATKPSKAPKAPKAPQSPKPPKSDGTGAALEPVASAKPKAPKAPKAPRRSAPKHHDEPKDNGVSIEAARVLSEVTFEMIAVRAYFLAENRMSHGIHGDPSSDWHEAERQLRAESAAIAASLNHGL